MQYCEQILYWNSCKTLHNQLQSANMSPLMVKRQLFYKVCVCKNSYVDNLVNFGQPVCPLVAQMFFNILLYISIFVGYVTKRI